MQNNNQNIDFLDILTIFSVILQVMGYQENKQQSSTDDLMQELQKQDREYLGKLLENQKIIIQNQKEILEKLAKLG